MLDAEQLNEEEISSQSADDADVIPPFVDKEVANPVTPGWLEMLGFQVSLAFAATWRETFKWGVHWNEILPGTENEGPLFLGGLPIKTQIVWKGGHDVKLMAQCREQNHELGLVVSMVRKFELNGYGLPVYPVSSDDWKEHGVKQIICPMEDHSVNIDLPTLKRLVDLIHQARTEGVGEQNKKGIFVHCKAGVGRSFTVVFAYLVIHCGMNVEEAADFLRSKRPEVAITEQRKQLIRDLQIYLTGIAPQHEQSEGDQRVSVEEITLRRACSLPDFDLEPKKTMVLLYNLRSASGGEENEDEAELHLQLEELGINDITPNKKQEKIRLSQ